ncbi:CIC11C00000001977 [Sungouiella intermedia]|uniref:CIC11C00000001977 n=1 Tax=Sungouiella intermedia TaxID=45354 RepID=A0A1L0C1S4_9ASCO|nr:CIC11C00000001977 [[Candida] intermedia]
MNLETRLTDTLNDVLRTSGYIFEMINNNKRQSNLITGPNNQLIPPQVTNQLTLSIAQFDQILDETVSKFNDARWCIEQMVESKQKQEELRIQEELERQKKAEAERKRKEEEAAALRKKEEEKRLAEEKARKEEEERIEREAKEKRERELREAEERKQKEQPQMDDIMDSGFDFDMDMDKGLDIPNPSDILSSMNFKDGEQPSNKKKSIDDMDLDMNNVLGGEQSLLDEFNMDMLGKDMDGGMGGAEEEFDVDNFLNQFGNGD